MRADEPEATAMRVEVAVVGGGPAGAAAARRLAEDGHRVVVLTRPTPGGRALAESLPPSARKLLRVLGLQDAIDEAGFLPTTGNTVWWGSADARVALFPNGASGYQVDRARFDAVVLEAARAAGATVRPDAFVYAVDRGRPLRVRAVDAHGTPFAVEADYVLDCSGRAGVLARRLGRREERGARTLALLADWMRPDGWPLPDPAHTLVESYGDGWVWSVPRSTTVRLVACMIDGRKATQRGAGPLAAIYRSELAKTRAVASLLAAAVQTSPVWACDATMSMARQVAGPGYLLVGDAASALDPLSSYGIKKALASAWLAATAVNTALVRPAMAQVAFEYFAAREAVAYAASRAQSVRYFRQADAAHAHPFWRVRADLDTTVPWAEEADAEDFRSAPDVREAFTRLRQSTHGRVRLTDRFRLDLGPAVVGREIALVPRVVSPALPGGLRYLRGIDVPRVVELARSIDTVPDLFAAYTRDGRPAGLADFLGVVAVLLARGVLALVDERAASRRAGSGAATVEP